VIISFGQLTELVKVVMADVAFGAIPLAIQALQKIGKYVEGYREYELFIQGFQGDLQLQQYHLDLTLSNIGIESGCSIQQLQQHFSRAFLLGRRKH
jgi:hypothetical protein